MALVWRLLAALLLCAPTPVLAQEPEVAAVSLRAVEEGLVLDADFAFDLSPRLVDVLRNGVPLYFVVEFELTRGRWYWLDEQAANAQLQMRLSYHALSRQYRLSSGTLQQSFASLDEAMSVLKHVRNWLVVDRTVTFSDADYDARIRLRLDTSLLPKPFQLSALTGRDLQLETPWRRFIAHSPQQLPAPVESREPQGREAR